MRRALVAAVAGLAAPAAAGSFQALIDNDVVFGTDRGYTSGVRLSWLADAAAPDAPRPEFGLVQDIYTPDTKRDIRGQGDRPYVGRLRLFGAVHAIAPGRFDTLEASAGVAGSSALGRQSQELIHRVVPSPETDWSRELPDRFDGAIAGTLTRVPWRQPGGFALAVHGGAVLGTMQGYAHAGAEIRFGGEGAPWSATLRHAATPAGDAGGEGGFSAFLGASVKGVFRDRLIERNADDPGLTLERRRAVGRVAGGVAWSARWGTVTFALAQDSDAFAQQRYPQRFGSLAVAIPLD